MKAKVNGTELFYITCGEGSPIMFMHGGLGADHTYFRKMFDPLSDQYQLIYYDHRGNGRSRPAELTDMTHADWATDADALRQHLGHEKIILIGHSYGGFLAQEYALRYADHLQGVVFMCTAPALDYPEVMSSNADAKATSPESVAAVEQAFSDDLIESDDEFAELMGKLEPLYLHNYEAHQTIMKEVMKDMQFSAAAWNHVNANCIPEFNVESQLSSISVPTLIISGRHDWVTPVSEGGQRIANAIPKAELLVFENSGHYPFVEENELFFSKLTDWLKKTWQT